MNKKGMLYLNLSILILCLYGIAFSADEGLNKSAESPIPLSKIIGYEDRKMGIHDGNKIYTIFYNFGGIGNWTAGMRVQSGVYPKGSGHSYFAEFTPLVGTGVRTVRGDSIHIFSDGLVDAQKREESPEGVPWGFNPLPGYANPVLDDIAMSDNPVSWPDTWPDRDATWDGYWNGDYGKYARADQESYYRMNDYDNAEFEFYPDPNDSTMRGLGLEVAVRGYQWAHVAAEDILIWTYRITNKSPRDYQDVVFGMYGDADVGDDGDQRDDDANFDTFNDIVYQYDHDNRGAWGGPCAYFGYKFLESPGNPYDRIDNDEDGLVDESQYDSLDNDQDWNPLADDIGSDGIPSEDPNYPGPDADGSEGNGVPDVGEPNFEITDNDEVDKIGLTSFNAAPWPSILLHEDEPMWNRMKPGNFDEIQQTVDLTFVYGSGYIPLHSGETKKFAIALLFGEDYNDIIRNAVTMQSIYDSDYSFAKPPLKPSVTAVPGDHKVTLYWDKLAEQSRDPIYGYDFEGYAIYRATDPGFLESWTITDADGNKTFNKPIAIFDLKDGLKGPHPIGINGAQFQMGFDSGLRYTFTDTTVENGQTYYYAVCSYDHGYDLDFYERGISELPNLLPIAPAECTKRIDVDVTGNIVETDVNTVMVVPNAPSGGYVPPSVAEVEHVAGIGSGGIEIIVIDPGEITDTQEYKLYFNEDQGLTYSLYTIPENELLFENSTYLSGEDLNPTFDGLRIIVYNEDKLEINLDSLRWIKGESNYRVTVDPGKPYRDYAMPADYEIHFLEPGADTSFATGHLLPFKIINLMTGEYIKVRAASPRDSTHWSFGDDLYFYEYVPEMDAFKFTWKIDIVPPDTTGGVVPIAPQSGDIYLIKTSRPFTADDVFRFKVEPAIVDRESIRSAMDDIAVVPNPYVVTASWEKQHFFISGRGEQKIDFIHLPAKCTIKIFTIRGYLVKTIDRDSPISNGAESWDLITKDGMRLAYGIYFYHVEAPGIGEKIGKFAVIQ